MPLGPAHKTQSGDLVVITIDDILPGVLSGADEAVTPTVIIVADLADAPGRPTRRFRFHFPAEMMVWLLERLPDVTEESLRNAERGRQGLDP